MAKTDWILWMCKDTAHLHFLTNMLGWPKGATYATVSNLIENGMLKRTERGVYSTTPKGIKKARKALEKELEPSKYVERVVNRVSAQITVSSPYDSVTTLKVEKDSWKPPERTKDLRRELRDIYLESADPAHRDDHDLVVSMWRNHRKPSCGVCSFNFEESYERNAKLVERYANKRMLFRKLRWESFSDVEKYKKNFGLKTTYKTPDIPADWD